MIFIPTSEIPDLIAALGDRITELSHDPSNHPEGRQYAEAMIATLEERRATYTAALKAWDGSERAHVALLRDYCDRAANALGSSKGRHEFFAGLVITLDEELIDAEASA